jgi:protein gp37
MGATTGIEWCDHTFNPWTGCQAVSPACYHCYAEALEKRFGHGDRWGPHGDRLRTSAANWQQPLKWNRAAAAAGIRARVFCASMADVFDNRAATRWRDDLWHLIHQTPHLDWLLLTKRPQNICGMLPTTDIGTPAWGLGWPNVWLGTTVENQVEADRRIPKLLEIPAAVHFLSCEPLLGPVDLQKVQAPRYVPEDHELDWKFDALLVGDHYEFEDDLGVWDSGDGPHRENRIDWVICGGESGPHARPMHPDWARSLRDQCAAAGVPFFFKQWGEFTPGENVERQSGTVKTAHWFDEKWAFGWEYLARHDGHIDDEPDLYRVGKKAAGAILDGKEHRAWPAVTP